MIFDVGNDFRPAGCTSTIFMARSKSIAFVLIVIKACEAAFTIRPYPSIGKVRHYYQRTLWNDFNSRPRLAGRKASTLQTKMHAYINTKSWKGFISSNTVYVDEDMIESAIFEHIRNVDGNHRTLVHTNINLHHWLCGSKLKEQYGHIHFNALFNETDIDERTPADLYIVKAQDHTHQFTLYRIIGDLVTYADSTGCLSVGGGYMVLSGEVRRPDVAADCLPQYAASLGLSSRILSRSQTAPTLMIPRRGPNQRKI